ncbi:flagellar basal body rod protein FlgB [bacterium]|nr:flagellar basal body rod protein FlgB [bacterium]
MPIDFSSQWLQQLNRVMDLLTVQQKTIAQNVANTNTPGYIRHTVDFSAELERIMESESGVLQKSSQPQSIATAENKMEIIEDTTQPARADGNNVALEKEMVDLAQVSQLYNMMTRIASKDIKSMRYVISGGR